MWLRTGFNSNAESENEVRETRKLVAPLWQRFSATKRLKWKASVPNVNIRKQWAEVRRAAYWPAVNLTELAAFRQKKTLQSFPKQKLKDVELLKTVIAANVNLKSSLKSQEYVSFLYFSCLLKIRFSFTFYCIVFLLSDQAACTVPDQLWPVKASKDPLAFNSNISAHFNQHIIDAPCFLTVEHSLCCYYDSEFPGNQWKSLDPRWFLLRRKNWQKNPVEADNPPAATLPVWCTCGRHGRKTTEAEL